MGITHIHAWNTYRQLVQQYTPTTVFYSLDPHPLRRPPWGLKLIFYHGHDSYVFHDYADGAIFHKTKIPVTDNDPRHVPIHEDDLLQFIHEQLGSIHISPVGAFLSL